MICVIQVLTRVLCSIWGLQTKRQWVVFTQTDPGALPRLVSLECVPFLLLRALLLLAQDPQGPLHTWVSCASAFHTLTQRPRLLLLDLDPCSHVRMSSCSKAVW